MPKYVVNFGSIKVGEGQYVGTGQEIELDANDPIVTQRHPVMALDREGQPYHEGAVPNTDKDGRTVYTGGEFVTQVSPVKAAPAPVVQPQKFGREGRVAE